MENVERFDTISAFVNTITERKTHDGWGSLDSNTNGDSGWYGTKSFGEALAWSVTGYDEGLRKMREQTANITDMNVVGVGDKPKVRNYHVGGSPNVSRAVMGLPRDMRQMHVTRGKSKCVDLYMVMQATSDVSVDTMSEVGAKQLAIVSMLERNGYSVRLSTCSGVCSRNELGVDEFGWCVTLKGYRDVIDYQKLSFAMTNPAWFRRFGFRYIETYPGYTRSGRMTAYGTRTRHLWDDFGDELAKSHDNTFVIDFDELRYHTATDWLRRNGFIGGAR